MFGSLFGNCCFSSNTPVLAKIVSVEDAHHAMDLVLLPYCASCFLVMLLLVSLFFIWKEVGTKDIEEKHSQNCITWNKNSHSQPPACIPSPMLWIHDCTVGWCLQGGLPALFFFITKVHRSLFQITSSPSCSVGLVNLSWRILFPYLNSSVFFF